MLALPQVVGAGLVLMLASLFFIYYPTNEIYWIILLVVFIILIALEIYFYKNPHVQLNNALRALNNLQKKLFYIYVKRDYAEKHYFYERELHYAHENMLLSLQTINDITIKNQLIFLYETITAISNLRYRIKDQTILEVCEKEFLAISINLAKTIYSIAHKKNSNIEFLELRRSIKSFKKIYNNTLQVVVNNPLNFLIFIQMLQDFYKNLRKLSINIRKL